MTRNQLINIQKIAIMLLGSKNINMTPLERFILANNLHGAHADHITLLAKTVNEIIERENPVLGGRRRRTRRNKKSKRSKKSKKSTRRR